MKVCRRVFQAGVYLGFHHIAVLARLFLVKLQQSLYCLYFQCHNWIKNFKGCKIISSSLKPFPWVLVLRLGHENIVPRLTKIFPLAMPQFLVAFICFATMLQRYKFFLNCARNRAIIFAFGAKYSTIHLFKYDRKVFNFSWKSWLRKSYYYIYYNIYNNKTIISLNYSFYHPFPLWKAFARHIPLAKTLTSSTLKTFLS